MGPYPHKHFSDTDPKRNPSYHYTIQLWCDCMPLFAVAEVQWKSGKQILLKLGTCEASRFDSNSNRTCRFEFD